MVASPLELFVSPVQKVTISGSGTYVRHYQVINAGTRPLLVSAAPVTNVTAVTAGGKPDGCKQVAAHPSWMSLSPSRLGILQPRQSKTVTVVMHLPAGKHPVLDLGMAVTASGRSVTGNGTVSGRVVTQIVVTGTGHAPSCASAAIAAVHRAPGLPWLVPLVIALVLALGIGAGLWRTVRHRRAPAHERSHEY